MNKLIIHNNKFAQLVTEDSTLFNKVRNFLSYRLAGVEFTAAYQNGWNGMTYLLDKKGYFLLGLIKKVRWLLNKSNVIFVEEDLRKPVIENSEIDISERLKELGLVPRDYQERILQACVDNEKGIVRACTASGKTLVTAMLTAKFNKPTIIYVIGLNLLKQFYDLFSSIFNEKIGFIGNGVCDIQRINIASIWTVSKALNIKGKIIDDDEIELKEKSTSESQNILIRKMLKETKIHILDESHVANTTTLRSIFNEINPERMYGFSGTPFRDDNSDLLMHGILGEQIVNISASELISKGVLAQPIIKFVSVPTIDDSPQQYQSVYKEYIVENEVRNNLIVKNVKDLLEKKYTPLVLFKQIRHGEALFEKFKDAGIKCEMLNGLDSLDKRIEIMKKIETKEIDLIIASMIFDIGIDLPPLNSLVLAGGGRSSIRCLQRCGRIIRPYPGKKIAAIIDFFDQAKHVKKHSQIRAQIYASEPGFKIIKCPGMK